LEAQTKLEEDTAKKEAKAEAKAEAELKKKMASQVHPVPSFNAVSAPYAFVGHHQAHRAHETQTRYGYYWSRQVRR